MTDPHEQKVFPASARKRRRARENGQVVISPDLLAGVFLLAVTTVLHFCGHHILNKTGFYLRGSLEQIQTTTHHDTSELSGIFVGQLGLSARYFLGVLWPIWSLSLIAVVTVFAQTRGLFHWSATKPDLQRINPSRGIQKYSLAEIWSRVLTASIKLTGLSFIAWTWAVKHHELESHVSLSRQTEAGFDQLISFLWALSGGLLLWGGIDYVWRRFRFERNLRMSAREIADEQKQFDPDPNITQKSRRLREQISSGLSVNPKTDLLITNGLTDGVLLRYQPEMQDVPIILVRESGAAGVQLLHRCLQHQVKIHESKTLQEAISQRSDSFLPAEMWPEIAEIYANLIEKATSNPLNAEPAIEERVGKTGA